VTTPLELTHGELQVNIKLAAPVTGATGVLKVAVIISLFSDTPLALLAGATEVTVGPDEVPVPVPELWVVVPAPKPSMGVCPPPPPLQADSKTLTSSAPNQGMILAVLLKHFILFP
jgi:hypothetical protein